MDYGVTGGIGVWISITTFVLPDDKRVRGGVHADLQITRQDGDQSGTACRTKFAFWCKCRRGGFVYFGG